MASLWQGLQQESKRLLEKYLLPSQSVAREPTDIELLPMPRPVREGSVKSYAPPTTPRGINRSGGRRAATAVERDAAELKRDRTDGLRDQVVVDKRVKSYSDNTKTNSLLQQSQKYKKEHNIAARAPQEVKVVTQQVYARRAPLIMTDSDPVSADHILAENEQIWLRKHVRERANRKDGSSFTNDFLQAFDTEFGKRLTRKQMTEALRAMKFNYQKLVSTYYSGASFDDHNIARRRLIVPALHHVYGLRAVVPWNFDESTFYVSDFHLYGWVDETEENPDLRHISKTRAHRSGALYNVSAFISPQF